MLFSLGVKVELGTRTVTVTASNALDSPTGISYFSHGLDLSGEFLGKLPDIESVGWNI